MSAPSTFAGWLALLSALAAPAGGAALDPRRPLDHFVQDEFDSRSGLPQSFTSSVAQSPDGYLWVGTDEGLARFDGRTFATFDRARAPGLASNVVRLVLPDGAGGLWLGLEQAGLVHVTGGAFRSLGPAPGAPGARVRSLRRGPEGDLWVGSRDGGLALLRGERVIARWGQADGLPSDNVFATVDDGAGRVYVAAQGGVAVLENGRLRPGPAALQGLTATSLARTADGALWLGTRSGLLRWAGDRLITLGVAEGLPSALVKDLLVDRGGALWVGTGAGLARVVDGKVAALRRGALDTGITGLAEDDEGSLWVANQLGLARLRDGDFTTLGTEAGLPSALTFALHEDREGTLWVGTQDGLASLGPERGAGAPALRGTGAVLALLEDRHGVLWAGTEGAGIWRRRGSRFEHVDGGPPGLLVRALAEDADGTLWAGGLRGLFRVEGSALRSVREVPADEIYALLAEPGGGLWIGTAAHGLGILRGRTFVREEGGPPPGGKVLALLRDAEGTLWVGTLGAGLWRLSGGRWRYFGRGDGLFDDTAWSVVDDGAGRLWMSSNRGVYSVSKADLEARAQGRLERVASPSYGDADGLRGSECDAGGPAGLRARDGRLWFACARGAAVVDPARLRPAAPAPAVRIEALEVDGRAVVPAAGLALGPGTGRLTFRYGAVTLLRPERVRFRYRLTGYDTDWVEAGPDLAAQYTNLLPGDYALTVQAGAGAEWGPAARLAFTLRPDLWQRTGVRVAAALLACALAAALPLLRVRQLRTRERDLADRVRRALGEVKVLRGLLRVCAWCRRIRDADGRWTPLDQYVARHTEAQVTHGMCPDCYAERAGPAGPDDGSA